MTATHVNTGKYVMTNYLIDTHAHLDMVINKDEEKQATDNEIRETLSEMYEYGVQKVIIPAVEEKTLDRIVGIANTFENVFAMVGIFPSEAKTYTEMLETKLEKLAGNKKVVAVGEVGLDYYWDKSFNNIQKEVFIKQIKLANRLNLPIVVHDREAHKETFDIIKAENKGSKVIFHCFSGSVEFMKECTREGWYIALGGVVTFKNAVKMKDVAKEVPLDKLVLETDSPYLTPVPHRGKPNKPAYVKFVAEEISKIRGISFDEIAEITTKNAEEFFGI